MNGTTARRGASRATSHTSGKQIRINGDIRASTVRLIDPSGKQCGIVPLEEALRLTEEREVQGQAQLDLVEIAPQADPPVCQMLDYSKYIFTRKKKQTAQKSRVKVKELKFRPGTDRNDYEVKLRHLIAFLAEGDRVKISMRFRGREMEHREIGQNLIQKLVLEVESYGVVEVPARLEGRQMVMVVAPKKQGKIVK